jgi:hypothetical protein
MTTPWIEVKEHERLEVPAGPGYTDYRWQAQFACQVEVLPHKKWLDLRWGFNASPLFEEFLERQKLFLESQYEVRHQLGSEAPDYRTLAFRFISWPGKGLLFAILGKIHAKSDSEARKSAIAYYGEVKSTFPYDYKLVPAQTQPEFLQISGWNLLEEHKDQLEFAQIKRLEIPLAPMRNSPFLQGVWQTKQRAHEPIWRSLASSSEPVLFNISVRCTVLYEKEREKLLRFAEEISALHDQPLNKQTLSAMQQWNRKYVERRLVPWMKFFYLQVHLVSTCKLSPDLLRTVGTSLALNSSDNVLPGYQVLSPDPAQADIWKRRIKDLDVIFSESYLPVSRLSEVADLQEVFAVAQLPYSPPENDFPNVSFIHADT